VGIARMTITTDGLKVKVPQKISSKIDKNKDILKKIFFALKAQLYEYIYDVQIKLTPTFINPLMHGLNFPKATQLRPWNHYVPIKVYLEKCNIEGHDRLSGGFNAINGGKEHGLLGYCL